MFIQDMLVLNVHVHVCTCMYALYPTLTCAGSIIPTESRQLVRPGRCTYVGCPHSRVDGPVQVCTCTCPVHILCLVHAV